MRNRGENIVPLKSTQSETNSATIFLNTPQLVTEGLKRALGVIVAQSQADLRLVKDRAEAIAAMASAKLAEAEARVALMESRVADRLAGLKDGIDGTPGERGEKGDPGQEGPPGQDGKDGAAGRSFAIRGTWLESESYRELDMVALGGASFGARRDDPGPCPGDGWQLIAAQGKRGNAGERGASVKGERGPPGVPPASIAVDDDGLLTLTNADGSTVTCDLYPLLSRLTR